MDSSQPRLLDQVRHAVRRKHYALRTEEAYVGWIKRYMLFYNKRHPKEMGVAEVFTPGTPDSAIVEFVKSMKVQS